MSAGWEHGDRGWGGGGGEREKKKGIFGDSSEASPRLNVW